MPKELKLLFTFLIFQGVSYTQKFDIGINYCVSFAGPNSIIGMQDQIIYDNEKSFSTIRGSLGAGNSIDLHTKMYLKENLNLGLQYRYFNSFVQTLSNINTISTDYQARINAKQHIIEPTISFVVPTDKITFIMTSGFVVPIHTKSQQVSENIIGNSFIKVIENYTYNFTMGYTASLGFEVKLSNNLFFNSAIKSSLLNLTLKKKTSTSVYNGGTEISQNIPLYYDQTIFHENINNFSNNASINNEFDFNKPKDEVTRSQSFSSIGLTFGIAYRFSSRKNNQ
jgi:hypothetical protein